jgi:hypothetical protein
VSVQLKASLKLNQGAIDRARRLLRGAADKVHAHRATVGVHETEGAEAKLDYHGNATSASLAEVAAFHELVGGRSFLRTWFDENLEQLKREMTAAMRAEYSGDKEAVAVQAELWSKQLQDWISQQHGGLAALSDKTVQEKTAAGLAHPDVPLLATGQLLAAIRARLDGADA